MNCKFCHQPMRTRTFPPGNTVSFYCDGHNQIKVAYRDIRDQWIISNGDYRVSYWNGWSLIQKINHGAEHPQGYLTVIKRFDFDLGITPEEFSRKLKTILTFL